MCGSRVGTDSGEHNKTSPQNFSRRKLGTAMMGFASLNPSYESEEAL
jgi:hypothetical protein